MAQEISVLALGIITQPNEMGQYPVGALRFAQDVFIRAPGVIELSKDTSILHAVAASASKASEVLVAGDAELLCIDGSSGTGWEAQWFSGAGANTVSIPFTFLGHGLTNQTRSRTRYFVTCANGPIAFDFPAPVNAAQRTPRRCGLPAANLQCSLIGGQTNNAIAANTHASCIAIIKRVFPDGYELISATSLPCDTGFFAASALDIQVNMQWSEDPSFTEVLAGDIIEIYRTRSQSSGIAGIGGVSCDATYYLTTTHVVTSGEASSRSCGFFDATPDTGLGRQLYTNPGIGGGEATYICPPQSNITCTFKGYTFLFNIVEAAQAQLQVLGGIGYAALADPAAWRANIIGGREFTATWSNGSAVLTGISAAHMVGLRVGQNLRDDAVFVAHLNGMLISAVGASTVTISGVTATGAGTKTFVAYDTMVVDGDTGSYTNAGSGPPDLTQAPFTASLATIVGASYSGSRVSRLDAFQAASLAYFSSTFLCAPTPSRFSIAKKHAVPFGGASGNITITATNGQNYQPTLPEFGSTAKTFTPVVSLNGFAWSEAQQPDAWPPANRGHVGSGRVLACAATADAIWLACTDGLWRLSGNGGAVGSEGYDWRLDLIDSTLVISGPQAITVLRDTVYMYTARGFVSVDDTNGVNDRLSEGIIGDQLPGVGYTDTNSIILRADEDKDEIWVIIGTAQARIWSYLTKTWVKNSRLVPTGANGTCVYWRNQTSLVLVDDAASSSLFFDPAGTTYAVGIIELQPVFAGDPFATKQWIDITWVFDPTGTNVSCSANFNGNAYYPFFVQAKKASTDLRVTFGVPRNSPAIGQSISTGIELLSSSGPQPAKLWGIRMRYTLLGEQQTRRVS